jgi:hypothetical protein
MPPIHCIACNTASTTAAPSPAHVPFGVRHDNELADEVLRHEIGLRPVEFGEPLDPTEQRLDLGLLDVADQPSEGTPRAV